MPDGATWVFVVEPLGDDHCRLIVRFRLSFGSTSPLGWLAHRIIEPIHFVMERKQLLGIKERAEGGHAASTA